MSTGTADPDNPDNGAAGDRALARELTGSAREATLATLLPDGAPYGSLVLTAPAADGAPLLLLSDLAAHSRHIADDPRVSLLVRAPAGDGDPLDRPRLSLLGTAAVTTEPDDRTRFLARHPAAADYADFADFNFYRIDVRRAHLVAGFGRIRWLDAADLGLA